MNVRKYLSLLFVLIVFVYSAWNQEIHEAAIKGDLEKIKTLLEKKPELLEAKDQSGRRPLHLAAESGHIEIVKYLLSIGADPKVKTDSDTTSLHLAALNGHLAIVQVLLEKGADLEAKNLSMATPLFYAALQGHTETAEYLIEQGANIEAVDLGEKTPLLAASRAGHIETVKLLIEKGAEKDKKDSNGLNAVHHACLSGKMELVNFLMQKGLKTHEPDNFGKTPLFYAAENGNSVLVDMLLPQSIKNVNHSCRDGSTYLHAAAKGGLADFAKKLIDRGAKVNIENVYGETPLLNASRGGHSGVSKILVDKGADQHARRNPELKGDYLGQKKPGLKPEIFAPGIISTSGLNERDASFSSDGMEFYFTQWPLQGSWDIMSLKQENGRWTGPQKASFSGSYHEAEAFFTPDEQQIFFISNRPKSGKGNPGTWEIWFVQRAGKGWGTPQILGPPFEGGYYTTFTKQWVMYYTVSGDLFLSRYVDGKFGRPERLSDNVNTGMGEYNSFIAPDGSYLVFTSHGWGDSFGEGDLYICFRKEDGTWTKARNMGPEINTFALEYCPSVSPDGKYFFFCSGKLGSEDIYWVDAKIIGNLKPDENKR